MRITRILILLLMFFTSFSATQAEDPDRRSSGATHFQLGVECRQDPKAAQQHFRDAAAAFDADWHQGIRTVALALNRGRAHFLAGNLHEAMRSFHDGLHLAPWNAALQSGLAECRAKITYPVENDPQLRVQPDATNTLRHRFSPNDLLVGSILFSLSLIFGLVRWFTVRPRFATVFLAIGLLGNIIVILFAVLIAIQQREEEQSPIVILREQAVLRTGNGDTYPARVDTPLPRGTELRYRTSRGNWVQVELPGGAAGWVRSSVILRDKSPPQDE